jgi:hypothetical protein
MRRRFPSRLQESEVKPDDLGQSTAALLQGLFEHLAQPAVHGRILVESVLGYIAAARHGLSESRHWNLAVLVQGHKLK